MAAVARAVGVCDRTVKKWVARHAEGALALGGPLVPPAALAAGDLYLGGLAARASRLVRADNAWRVNGDF